LRTKFSLTLLVVLSLQAIGQDWELIKKVDVPATITAFSGDKAGNLFVATARGELIKFNSSLEQLISNSVPNRNSIDLIEARNALTPITFSRQNQEVLVYDRFLANPIQYEIRRFSNRYVWLMSPAPDQDFWFLMNDPPTLVKYNRQTGTEAIRAQLQTNFQFENIQYLKVESNYILLVDSQFGIYVFDLFGNEVLHLEVTGVQHAHVSGDNMIAVADKKLFEYNLKNASRQELAVPLIAKGVIKSADKYYFFSQKSISLYQLN